MNETKPFLFAFLISFLSHGCLSAIILGFEQRDTNLGDLYATMRIDGIHIPVLLHMQERKKGELCVDILNSNAVKNSGVELLDMTSAEVREAVEKLPDIEKYFEDGRVDGERIYPVDVHEMFVPIQFDTDSEQVQMMKLADDITTECLAVERINGEVSIVSYLISYAFRKRTFFLSKKWQGGARILALTELSPESVELDQKALEEYYLSLRMPLENIGEQWPKLKETYEKQDNLSVLTPEELTLLCASVFEAEYYKKRSVRFSGQQPEQERKVMRLDFETAELGPVSQSLTTDNFVCRAEENGVNKFFYVTRSLNAEYSVFVQREEGDHVILDAYVKNIALLMHTAFRPTAEQLKMPA